MAQRDILAQLKNPKNTFYKDDFDLIIRELELGEYDRKYIKKCKDIIESLQKQKSISKDIELPDNMFINQDSLVSIEDMAKSFGRTIEEQIVCDINKINESDRYLNEFDEYIKKTSYIDEKFIDNNFSIFKKDEVSLILKNILLSESFLEKYFDILPHSAIGKYQKFSEDFFIKHYSNLDVKEVLKNKNNDWHLKDKRSSKLNMFLRLKGVN